MTTRDTRAAQEPRPRPVGRPSAVAAMQSDDMAATTIIPAITGGRPPGPPSPPRGVRRRPAAAPPPRSPRRVLIERFLSPALAVLAVALLPVAAVTTNLNAMTGWGLAQVLSVAAWAAIVCAIAACIAELHTRVPRIPMLGAATAVLILCTFGLPSIIEPAARFGTAYTIAGFVDVFSTHHGVLKPDEYLDARFWWPAFFAQWAWFRDAAGVTQLDVVLRWFPPLVVAVWAIGIYALARSMLGGTRAPWVAAWLFLGLNWIEQDYFSPQSIGMVLLLMVLTFALGPQATRRTDPSGAPGWPAPQPGAKRLPLWHRWVVSAKTPPNRPTLPPSQLLLVYFCSALAVLAIIPTHQLTPFAILGQLTVLAVVGRFRGRGLVLVGIVGVIVFILIAGRTLWESQLSLLVGSGGGGALKSGVADRLTGDTGQVVVKYLRVAMAPVTYLLGAIGAIVYWRRRRDLVPLGLAVVPVVFILQGYGGEVFLRVLLFALPILVILGTDALRALVRWRPMVRPVLAAGMVAVFGLLILIRGGNEAYQTVYPEDIALYRAVVDTTPDIKPGVLDDKGDPAKYSLMPLSDAGPTGVTGVLKFQRGLGGGQCGAKSDNLVQCVLDAAPDILISYGSIENQGVFLYDKAKGWSLATGDQLVASGKYTYWYKDGFDYVLHKVDMPPLPPAPVIHK